MEGDRKGGERSPRDPERKSPTQNKNSRRDSSAESPSTYVSARVQKVRIHFYLRLKLYLTLFHHSFAAYNMYHLTDRTFMPLHLYANVSIASSKYSRSLFIPELKNWKPYLCSIIAFMKYGSYNMT